MPHSISATRSRNLETAHRNKSISDAKQTKRGSKLSYDCSCHEHSRCMEFSCCIMREHDVFWMCMVYLCCVMKCITIINIMRIMVHRGCSWCMISMPNSTEVIVGHVRTKVGTVWISSLGSGRAWIKQTEINMSKQGYKLSQVWKARVISQWAGPRPPRPSLGRKGWKLRTRLSHPLDSHRGQRIICGCSINTV